MFEWAYAWARDQCCRDLSRMVSGATVRRLPGREEVSGVFDGREFQLTLWNFAAELTVKFERAVLPAGLRINESSVWGPQRQEAWTSGEAVQTGDPEFDLAFVVLGEAPGSRPDADSARRISSPLRACLRELRPELRDAYVFPERLQVPITPNANGQRTPRADRSLAWTAGRALLDFGRMPTAAELHAAIGRAATTARAIERSCSTVDG